MAEAIDIQRAQEAARKAGLSLECDSEGLLLTDGTMTLRADFSSILPRIKQGALQRELLVKAAKIKGCPAPKAIDATAGLGEDSLLLAAAGFKVTLYERNPVAAAMLADALRKASRTPELAPIAARMTLIEGDSLQALRAMTQHENERPQVIYLDPMFPEKQKSAATKKKFQLIHRIELPCAEESQFIEAAMEAHPRKLVVKRPPKGPYLAGAKPHYSITGKSVRYDCYVFA